MCGVGSQICALLREYIHSRRYIRSPHLPPALERAAAQHKRAIEKGNKQQGRLDRLPSKFVMSHSPPFCQPGNPQFESSTK